MRFVLFMFLMLWLTQWFCIQELLSSLNETKRSSSAISESLEESAQLRIALQAECDVFSGLARYGSQLYFAITDLARLNTVYQLSISAFLPLFQRTVASPAQVSFYLRTQITNNINSNVFTFYINH